MNKEQIKGGMKEAAGKVQKEFGKAVDSPKHEIEGGMKEAEGKTPEDRRQHQGRREGRPQGCGPKLPIAASKLSITNQGKARSDRSGPFLLSRVSICAR